MKKEIFTIITLSIMTMVGCKNNVEKKENQNEDTIRLIKTFKQDSINVNEYLTEKIKPIRENFKRLNSIENWTKIKVIELLESPEGGAGEYYFQNKKLEKIITNHFGETFQKLTEYYLKNGELSFVYEKSYKYNRPFYYDSNVKKENDDTEEFDFDKSEVIEVRSYFNQKKLIHQLNNQDSSLPLTNDYLFEEQKRLINEFEELIKKNKADLQ